MSLSSTSQFSCRVEKSKETEGASGFILKLYAMVNEASDDVITWTPSGDAFIIGHNLHALENETLPQFFRHNRFQSLVRQLNFYSFRKINKERNVWIYKHPLFHRDRPEDLPLVKRRTCPGMDGRKVRMSRVSARRLSNGQVSDDNSIDGSPIEGRSRRNSFSSVTSVRANALSRTVSVDGVVPRPHTAAEQSVIVSEVATKLEEYARKAGHGGPRRRGSSGIVTPNYNSMKSLSEPVISYDDEFPFNQDQLPFGFTMNDHRRDSLGLVSYPDEVSVAEGSSLASIPEENTIAENVSTPMLAKSVSDQIVQRLGSVDASAPLFVDARAAIFCLSNSNHATLELLTDDVLSLLASSKILADDFDAYRSALLPTSTPLEKWATGARSEMVRAFRAFAVNSVRQLASSTDTFQWTDSELDVLQQTEGLWQSLSS